MNEFLQQYQGLVAFVMLIIQLVLVISSYSWHSGVQTQKISDIEEKITNLNRETISTLNKRVNEIENKLPRHENSLKDYIHSEMKSIAIKVQENSLEISFLKGLLNKKGVVSVSGYSWESLIEMGVKNNISLENFNRAIDILESDKSHDKKILLLESLGISSPERLGITDDSIDENKILRNEPMY